MLCHRAGLLTEADWLAWRLGFTSYSTWLRCREKLAAEGLTFATPNGYEQQRPEVAIAKAAWQQVLAFCREFGLTPSSRNGLQLEPLPNGGNGGPASGQGDGMEGLLN